MSGGRFSAGQTMESSSVVRVIEVKSPVVAQDGMAAAGMRRTMAYRLVSWWNFSFCGILNDQT